MMRDSLTREDNFFSLTEELNEDEIAALIATLGSETALSVNHDWKSWRHDGQDPPDGDWRTWVIMAGRGYGKTRGGAEWIAAQARENGDLRIALVAATLEEAERIMVEGQSGLLAVAHPWVADWLPHRRLLRFKNGAEATTFSGASPDALRGPEHHVAWCDELAKWEKPGETWDMLQLGMRLGEHPRVAVTTTPRPGSMLTRIMAAKGCVVTVGKTRENPHLPAAYVETVEELYAGTRLGRQELDGELLPDVAGALWSVELLERCRLSPSPSGVEGSVPRTGPRGSTGLGWGVSVGAGVCGQPPPPSPPLKGRGGLARNIIGVDPPSGDGTCGIIACALDADGIAYVLADHSVSACSPERWAKAVAAAAEVHGAQMVVAETNQGGQMVEAVLKAADAKLRVKAVHASMSKSDRAVPIATAFEAGKVRLCGRFEELEAQLCGLIAGGGYEGPGGSPDRADAMVWALSELMSGKERGLPRISVI
ncbi:MAG: terminase family protein [Sphingorhabdus sp.]